MGAVKLFQDGSLQGYTGYLSNPYHSLPDAISDGSWRGYPIYNPRELVNIVTRYHEEGWQVAIHGNGDAGIEDISTPLRKRKGVPRANARHIIIHCQTVREDQLDRIERLAWFRPSSPLPTVLGDRHRDIFLESPRIPDRSAVSARKRGIPFTSPQRHLRHAYGSAAFSVWSAVNRLTGSARCSARIRTVSVLDALKSVTIWAPTSSMKKNA